MALIDIHIVERRRRFGDGPFAGPSVARIENRLAGDERDGPQASVPRPKAAPLHRRRGDFVQESSARVVHVRRMGNRFRRHRRPGLLIVAHLVPRRKVRLELLFLLTFDHLPVRDTKILLQPNYLKKK